MRENFGVSASNFTFSQEGSLIFVTGAPLSGKSTIAPLVTSSIDGCSMQNMDIFRLMMGREDEMKADSQKDAVLQFGSCDSYMTIGDGEYSEQSLIEGYIRNSRAVCKPLDYVIPKLEVQGAQNILFEGVQLLPSIVRKFMQTNQNSRFVIVTSTAEDLEARRGLLYTGEGYEFGRKYTSDRLELISHYLVSEAQQLPYKRVCVVDNSSTCVDAAEEVLGFLQTSGLITKKH